MVRPIRWYDYITLNIYFLGLTTLSQTNGLVFPLLVQQFVGEAQKGTYYGTVRLWTLMVALLMQALWGMLSDHTTGRWGRRRPFIFGGTLALLVFVAAIGLTAGMAGMTGYWILFGIALLMSVASNAGQAAQQALIPDIVPEGQRGRFSGVKAILEVPLPLILVSFTIARLISAGNLWGGLAAVLGVLVVTMAITMLVPEAPLAQRAAPLNWQPFLRLLLMTALFSAIILGAGALVRWLGELIRAAGSIPLQVAVMGLAGLLAMVLAVAVGVWISVRVSIGSAAARANPSFTWWVINRLAFLVGVINLSGFAVYFIQARLGIEGEKAAGPAAIMMLIVGVCILLAALPSGWLADRFGRKRLVAVSGVLATAGTAIALLLPNLQTILAGGVLIGVATGFFFAANWALGTSLVPKAEAARYLGISNLAGAGAGAVGGYIGGPIADYFTANVPSVQGLGYILLFAIYGMMCVVSIVALRGIHEERA
jgi:MFS family permease